MCTFTLGEGGFSILGRGGIRPLKGLRFNTDFNSFYVTVQKLVHLIKDITILHSFIVLQKN